MGKKKEQAMAENGRKDNRGGKVAGGGGRVSGGTGGHWD